MYRKHYQSWMKYMDFMVMDLICLHIAYLAAYMIRHGRVNPYAVPLYRNTAIVLTLISFTTAIFMETFKDVLKRGYYQETVATLRHVAVVLLGTVFYLFVIQEGESYSRITVFLTGVLYSLITYIARSFRKRVIRNRKEGPGSRSLLIVTSGSELEECLKNLEENKDQDLRIVGFVLSDEDRTGQMVSGYPVVSDLGNLVEYVCAEWIDELLIVLPEGQCLPEDISCQLDQIGVVLHVKIAKESEIPGRKQFAETIGNYTVLTTSMNYATPGQLFLKRTMDIVGGLIGCTVTVILFFILAPIIKIQSPGPVFFSQVRVGRNGKRFKIFKFRTMYPGAEERKAELREQNKLQSDCMFKMDFDPRVIGNKVLPDGSYKRGFFDWCRRASLDEFPQFFNVLLGDLSLVGTRPPTVEEVKHYAPHHHARLAIKPGITGLWQVSGRSDITDFEEVVKLDTQYINEWNIGLDIRILIRTVAVTLGKNGAM